MWKPESSGPQAGGRETEDAVTEESTLVNKIAFLGCWSFGTHLKERGRKRSKLGGFIQGQAKVELEDPLIKHHTPGERESFWI